MNRLIPWICGGILASVYTVLALRAIAQGRVWIGYLSLGIIIGVVLTSGAYALLDWEDRRRG